MKTRHPEIDEKAVPRHRIGYAQKFLGLSRDGVISAVNRGDLTAYKMGQLRFTDNDLEQYREKCRTDNDEEETSTLEHLDIDPNRKPLMT
ncbi:MAG: helix-turn-helix domain-containing protein [Planctomycetes bacterium]|nr:helix-turn-helix domain-containing protein [Planctomycetota bacterium]